MTIRFEKILFAHSDVASLVVCLDYCTILSSSKTGRDGRATDSRLKLERFLFVVFYAAPEDWTRRKQQETISRTAGTCTRPTCRHMCATHSPRTYAPHEPDTPTQSPSPQPPLSPSFFPSTLGPGLVRSRVWNEYRQPVSSNHPLTTHPPTEYESRQKETWCAHTSISRSSTLLPKRRRFRTESLFFLTASQLLVVTGCAGKQLVLVMSHPPPPPSSCVSVNRLSFLILFFILFPDSVIGGEFTSPDLLPILRVRHLFACQRTRLRPERDVCVIVMSAEPLAKGPTHYSVIAVSGAFDHAVSRTTAFLNACFHLCCGRE